MTKKNDGGHAFPVPGMTALNDQVLYPEYGMSLRDFFAGQALVGLVIACTVSPKRAAAMAQIAEEDGESIDYSTAAQAYELADAMLRAREKL